MRKTSQHFLLAACVLGVTLLAEKLTAGDKTPSSNSVAAASADTTTNAIPDLLKTCPVSGDKLGGDMGEPYVFVYKGQQVKLCCKSCKADFDKNPAKYMKLIRAADKKK
jgi:YHS domain-containing protein